MTTNPTTSSTKQADKAVAERKASRTRKASAPTGVAANVAGAKALENRKGRTTAKQAEVVKPDLVTDGQGAAVAIPAEEETAKVDPATKVFPTATQTEVDRVERLRLAEEEAKALKAWQQAGEKGDRPETPHFDAIKAGAAAPSSPKAAAKKSGAKAAKVETPPPAARRGFVVLALRSDKHANVLTAALGKAKLDSTITGHYFEVKGAEAQTVLDKLAEASSADKLPQYDGRLLTATTVQLRHAFPKLTEKRSSTVAKLVSALNDAVTSGKLASWSVDVRADGTLGFSAQPKSGKPVEGGARDLLARYGTPAAA